jgi:hypothetical protein
MKHVACVAAVAICLGIFGVPLVGLFTGLLVLPGLAVETAFPIAAIATGAVVTATAIKAFYSDK